MYKNLMDFFDVHISEPLNIVTYRELETFRQDWISRSEDHVRFLGGNLLGVHEIRFTRQDAETILYDILGIDAVVAQSELYQVPDINRNYRVSSNLFNQTMVYLIRHVLFMSNDIGNREFYARSVFHILAYRFLSSLLVHRFRYKLDEQVALYVYEQLSEHFLIKRLGSWYAVIDYRANDLVLPDGLHYDKLRRYETKQIVDTVNDIQGRFRTMINNLFSVTMEIKTHGDYVKSQSLTQTDTEGLTSVRDIESRQTKMVDDVKAILFLKDDFIKDDYLYIVNMVVTTLDGSNLKHFLEVVSQTSDTNEKRDLLDIVEKVIVYSIQYLTQKRMDRFTTAELLTVLRMLRNYWMASKLSDKRILELKKTTDKLVVKSFTKLHRSKIAGVRVGFFLYVFLIGYLLSR